MVGLRRSLDDTSLEDMEAMRDCAANVKGQKSGWLRLVSEGGRELEVCIGILFYLQKKRSRV